MINKEKASKMLMVAIATTLMGQVYINPFNSPFRLSIGIAILTFLLLKFQDISIMFTTLYTAVFVFIFRSSIDLLQFSKSLGPEYILLKHFPSAIYYIVFGFVLFHLHIRQYREQPVYFIFLVGISDIVSNIAEAAVRQEFTINSIEIVLTSLFLAGFLRATIAMFLYYSLKAYNMLILKEEHEERYESLLLFTAKMRAEVFFLQKTMQDIENAMERCYSIYREIKNRNETLKPDYINRLQGRILNLSKDIHEIKKDNQRVISGIEGLMPELAKDNVMNLSTIFQILQDNTERYIESLGKEINIFTNYYHDVAIADYFPLITILNNLINNAIDAIDREGYINISQYNEEKYLVFQIIDSGVGIKEQDIDVVFEPGFSTKFDKKTGNMSTGIGLTHVKHIVEKYYSGRIEVKSKIGQGATFIIYIPIVKIGIQEGE